MAAPWRGVLRSVGRGAATVGRAAWPYALAAVPAGVATWGLAETRMFTLRHDRVTTLTAGSEPLRILHLSDLHLLPTQRAKLRWLRSLKDVEVDLVVVTGDLIASPDAIEPLRQALGGFLDVPGLVVFGSNDYVAPRWRNPLRYLAGPSSEDEEDHPPTTPLPTDELRAMLTSGAWVDLTNRRGSVEVRGVRVTAVGVDDPHLDRDRFPAPDAEAAEVPEGPSVHLGVTHAPYTRVLDDMADDGCDLILAGHTHGGQVRVPFYGALVTNCDLDTGRASGLHGWPGERPDRKGGEVSTWLHVSAGLGTSPYAQVRFACRPEATVLTLVTPRGEG
ncbi:metallophosphoesterase [Georgenia sp. Z1344]|uniref:metallophosphoesterase n=1 Tax=Georgenia sp. Z1344 TaxID=3416706 RepID=UPI003CFB83AE